MKPKKYPIAKIICQNPWTEKISSSLEVFALTSHHMASITMPIVTWVLAWLNSDGISHQWTKHIDLRHRIAHKFSVKSTSQHRSIVFVHNLVGWPRRTIIYRKSKSVLASGEFLECSRQSIQWIPGRIIIFFFAILCGSHQLYPQSWRWISACLLVKAITIPSP